jgi:hypothetical protein
MLKLKEFFIIMFVIICYMIKKEEVQQTFNFYEEDPHKELIKSIRRTQNEIYINRTTKHFKNL